MGIDGIDPRKNVEQCSKPLLLDDCRGFIPVQLLGINIHCDSSYLPASWNDRGF
jgi:hypothetical protein